MTTKEKEEEIKKLVNKLCAWKDSKEQEKIIEMILKILE